MNEIINTYTQSSEERELVRSEDASKRGMIHFTMLNSTSRGVLAMLDEQPSSARNQRIAAFLAERAGVSISFDKYREVGRVSNAMEWAVDFGAESAAYYRTSGQEGHEKSLEVIKQCLPWLLKDMIDFGPGSEPEYNPGFYSSERNLARITGELDAALMLQKTQSYDHDIARQLSAGTVLGYQFKGSKTTQEAQIIGDNLLSYSANDIGLLATKWLFESEFMATKKRIEESHKKD